MKNVMKIIGYVALALGCIAFVVCLIAIPNETKEFFGVVADFLDRPFILCGATVTIGGILLFFIIRYLVNNTSVGKKMLNKLEKKIDDNNKAQDKKLDDMDKTIEQNDKENKDAISGLKNELGRVANAVNLFPNKKVQEALNNGREEEKIG